MVPRLRLERSKEMSETPWTPGPWVVRVAGKDNLPYGITAPDQPYDRKGGIRDITRWAAITLPSSKEGQANARLIAAAPEMAEALEECANRLKHAVIFLGKNEKLAEEDVSKYRALLSRIRGDAP
jgi:hypothetical protein